MRMRSAWLAGLATALIGAAPDPGATGVTGEEPVVGGPCEGCEAVFQGLPGDLRSAARIAPPEEAGEPLRIEGTVFLPDGAPAPGIVVYAYHTDRKGIYPPDESLRGSAARRHGRLRGWAVTDDRGRYRFDTVRPGSYPDTEIPQHIHMHVIEPGRCTYYIDDIHFTDDEKLTPRERKRSDRGRGGSGVATPERDDDGIWHVRRDILLGEGIPGYPARSQ